MYSARPSRSLPPTGSDAKIALVAPSQSLGGCGDRLEGYAVAEVLQLVEGALPGADRVTTSEIVSSWVVVLGSGVGHVPDGDQGGVFDRDEGFLRSATSGDPVGTWRQDRCRGCSRSTVRLRLGRLSGRG